MIDPAFFQYLMRPVSQGSPDQGASGPASPYPPGAFGQVPTGAGTTELAGGRTPLAGTLFPDPSPPMPPGWDQWGRFPGLVQRPDQVSPRMDFQPQAQLDPSQVSFISDRPGMPSYYHPQPWWEANLAAWQHIFSSLRNGSPPSPASPLDP